MLRPPALRETVEGFYEPGHSAVLAEERSKGRIALRELEDSAIRESVRRQIDLGLDVVTHGELRRGMFLNSFYDAVEGFRIDNVVNLRNARGEDVPLRVPEIVERLRPVDSPAAREPAFMTETAPGTGSLRGVRVRPVTSIDHGVSDGYMSKNRPRKIDFIKPTLDQLETRRFSPRQVEADQMLLAHFDCP